MKLDQAVELELPLVAEIAPDNRRIMAHAFVEGDIVVFADIGWDQPAHPGHPFHRLEGQVQGEGPWRVGSVDLVEIEHGDPLAEEWNAWLAYRQSTEGAGATRPAARAALKQEGLL